MKPQKENREVEEKEKETNLVERNPKMSKKMIVLLWIAILVVQAIVCSYFGTQKEYFHMDEMYSYGLMNADEINITDRSDFLNQWHDKQYYLDYLEVNQEEVWDFSPVWENQVNDVHPPLYYLLLRISATFSIDHFTKWTGLFLNLVIFAISNYFIYQIGKKLTKSPIYALLICLINGFTIIVLESFLYIRMYALCNLMVLILVKVHLDLNEKQELHTKDILLLVISLVLGGLTHYYYFIFALGIYLVYTKKKIAEKAWKNLAYYQLGIVIAGLLYLPIFPFSIDHILWGERGVSAQNGTNLAFQIGSYLILINQNFFNNLTIAFLIVLYLLYHADKKKVEKIAEMEFIWFPILLYLCIVILQAPYVEIRYIIPIASCFNIWVVILVKNYLEASYSKKKAFWITVCCFTILLISPLFTQTKLSFTYQQHHQIATRIEEKGLPIVYLWNPGHNRFLDDLYLFTKVDQSIIIDATQDIETIQEMLSDIQTDYILMYNEGIEEETLETCIPENNEYIQKMNACDILLVRQESEIEKESK